MKKMADKDAVTAVSESIGPRIQAVAEKYGREGRAGIALVQIVKGMTFIDETAKSQTITRLTGVMMENLMQLTEASRLDHNLVILAGNEVTAIMDDADEAINRDTESDAAAVIAAAMRHH